MRQVGVRAVVVCACVLLCAPAAARAATVDPFTLDTPPLRAGEIELVTLSAPPGAVTGGDVLVAVRGLGPRDRMRVWAGRRDVTGAFGPLDGGERRGLVENLREGVTRLAVSVRGPLGVRRAALRVRSHPVTGPVISGPHQEPFYCETEESGLGPPLDEDCSVPTRLQWFYRSRDDGGGFHELEDPYAPYPDDVAQTTTSDGRTVPFVVRVESGTINRGITRIAVLDDPHARGRDRPFDPTWSSRLTYAFGESCGVGYHQGSSSPATVLGAPPTGLSADSLFATIYGLADRLGAGDAIAHSTMTTFGVYCNPLVSAETLMMVKEHIAEDYGPIARTVGVGGSGGALQIYNAANNYPGLIDGGIPIASFTDIPSTAMTTVDCGLLVRHFERSDFDWPESDRAAVAGHATSQICEDWVELFLDRLDPFEGCSGEVPAEVRYDAQANPDGVRCALQDATSNIWGIDPATGFARRPYDNVGVQYGLRALNAGEISVEQFIELNGEIGGYDIDANPMPQRSAMDAETAATTYRLGGVIGRGSLRQTPIIDLATYLDLIPLADIHDVVRPFQVRARLARDGVEESQSIWRGLSLPADAQAPLRSWIHTIESDRSQGRSRTATVAAAKPARAHDRCIVAAGARAEAPAGVTMPFAEVPLFPGAGDTPDAVYMPLQVWVPERQRADAGACEAAFPARSGTRIVAGGPFADDVIKCSLKPVDPADYAVALTGEQLAQLRAIFPDGACDWSRPGVGEVESSMRWPSLGGAELRRPHSLRWRSARSRLVR